MQMPDDYQQLVESGLVQQLSNPNDPLFIWDANFAYVAKNGFERLEDQVVEIYPFATTAGGHYFGYLVDRLPKSKIFLFYRDSYEAEPVASGLGEFLFRQIVQFSGGENLADSNWTEESARDYVDQASITFKEFLSLEMLSELEQISSSSIATTNTGWSTLILEEDAESLIEKFTTAGEEELEWRS